MPKKKRRPNPESSRPKGTGPTGPNAEGTRMKKVLVTPQLAEEWLKRNVQNRPCPDARVTRYATAMLAGEWKDNGAPICFNEQDEMCDGQGRLRAIVKSGVSVPMWVCYGVATDAFATFDQGKTRTLGDVFACARFKHYSHLATAVTLLYQIDETIRFQRGGLRVAVGLSIAKDRPEVKESVARMVKLEVGGVGSIGMCAALHCLMRKKDMDLADKLFENIANGATGKRNPARNLRDQMVQNKRLTVKDRLKRSPTYINAITIKAFNMMRQGRTCTRLTWNPEKENFPTIL